jgi:hypothetical protein
MTRVRGWVMAVAVLGLVAVAVAGSVWWLLLTAPQSVDHATMPLTAISLGHWLLTVARRVLAWL